MEIGYERLEVYQCTLEYLALTIKVIAEAPAGSAELCSQLKRSSFSIALNIAEGAGKTGKADKGRYYAHARGSAFESAAAYDVMHLGGLVTVERYHEAKNYLSRIVAMLTKLYFR